MDVPTTTQKLDVLPRPCVTEGAFYQFDAGGQKQELVMTDGSPRAMLQASDAVYVPPGHRCDVGTELQRGTHVRVAVSPEDGGGFVLMKLDCFVGRPWIEVKRLEADYRKNKDEEPGIATVAVHHLHLAVPPEITAKHRKGATQ